MQSGLQRRLALSFGILSLLVLAMAMTGLFSLRHVRNVTLGVTLAESEVSHMASDVAVAALLCMRHEKDVLLQVDDAEGRELAYAKWEGAVTQLRGALDAFTAAAREPEDRRQADIWRAALGSYHDAFLGQVVGPARRGELGSSTEALRRFQVFQGNISALTDLAVTVADHKERSQAAAALALRALIAQALRLLVGIGAAALVLAAVWSVLLPRRLLRPIAELERSATRLGEGELSARAEVVGDDELGRLGARFNQMAETLEQRTREREAQHAFVEAARDEAEKAKGELAAQLARVQAQQALIEELSVPVLPLNRRTLLLPLVGALDESRLAWSQERALSALHGSSARYLILDVTGVPAVTPQVAEGLIRLTRSASLLGVSTVLVGLRSEVARAIVEAEIDLGGITTRGTLQAGMAFVEAALRAGAHPGA